MMSISNYRRTYNLYRYSKENEYGEMVLGSSAVDSIKMTIVLASKSIQEDIRYSEAQYVGFVPKWATTNIEDRELDSNDVIIYDEAKKIYLKVLTTVPTNRFTIVYLKETTI